MRQFCDLYLTEGLPVDRGTTRAILAADPSRPGCFAAATNRGLYRSSDGARTWARVPLELPPGSAQALVLDCMRPGAAPPADSRDPPVAARAATGLAAPAGTAG